MSVDHEIHLILLQYPEIDLAHDGHRGSKEDILKLGGDHRASPAICQGAAGG